MRCAKWIDNLMLHTTWVTLHDFPLLFDGCRFNGIRTRPSITNPNGVAEREDVLQITLKFNGRILFFKETLRRRSLFVITSRFYPEIFHSSSLDGR